jgi:[ribosomal protein S5]-alanine N-acetyltransferase
MELLRTQRTIVRPFCDADLKPLIGIMTDAEVMRFTGFKNPQAEERIIELLAKWKSEGEKPFGVWAIENIETQKLVAWFMLKKTVSSDPEIGFMLERGHWTNGYATEVSEALLNYAFTHLKINRVIASTVPENLASIKVLKKIGMTEYPEPAGQPFLIYFEITRTL